MGILCALFAHNMPTATNVADLFHKNTPETQEKNVYYDKVLSKY